LATLGDQAVAFIPYRQHLAIRLHRLMLNVPYDPARDRHASLIDDTVEARDRSYQQCIFARPYRFRDVFCHRPEAPPL
jgi:hypothetical protein